MNYDSKIHIPDDAIQILDEVIKQCELVLEAERPVEVQFEEYRIIESKLKTETKTLFNLLNLLGHKWCEVDPLEFDYRTHIKEDVYFLLFYETHLEADPIDFHLGRSLPHWCMSEDIPEEVVWKRIPVEIGLSLFEYERGLKLEFPNNILDNLKSLRMRVSVSLKAKHAASPVPDSSADAALASETVKPSPINSGRVIRCTSGEYTSTKLQLRYPPNAENLIEEYLNRSSKLLQYCQNLSDDFYPQLLTEIALYWEYIRLFPCRWCQLDPSVFECVAAHLDNCFIFNIYKNSDIKHLNIEKQIEIPFAVFWLFNGAAFPVDHKDYYLNPKLTQQYTKNVITRLRLLKDHILAVPQPIEPPQPVEFTGEQIAAPAVPSQLRNRFSSLEGLDWNEITISFVSNDSVRVQARDVKNTLMFTEMGFKDKRKGNRPDTRWSILCGFARSGEISWKVPTDQSTRDKAKSAVKDIRNRLRQFFGIESDPFFPYREVNAYRPRFTVLDQRPDNTE